MGKCPLPLPQTGVTPVCGMGGRDIWSFKLAWEKWSYFLTEELVLFLKKPLEQCMLFALEESHFPWDKCNFFFFFYIST